MKIYSKLFPAILMAAGFYLGFSAYEEEPISNPSKVSASKSGGTFQSQVTEETNSAFCAILFMPKSYLPLLQQFAKRQLAEDIKIVPARIGWREDEMIVLPEEPILHKKSFMADSPTGNRRPTNLATVTSTPDIRAKFRAAAFLTLLTHAKESSLNNVSSSYGPSKG